MKNERICIILFLLSSYGAGAQNYAFTSEKKKIPVYGEKTSLTISTHEFETKTDKQATGMLVGSLVGPLIDVGISAAKNAAKRKAKQYIAQYSCANSGHSFYDGTRIQLPELTIKRQIWIQDKTNPREITRTDAAQIILTPEQSPDKLYFRFRIKSIDLMYSKARTKKLYDFIDFKLDITFKSLSVSSDKYEINELRAFTVYIPAVRPNTAYDVSTLASSNWLPYPKAPAPNVNAKKRPEITTTTKKYNKTTGQNSVEYTETVEETVSNSRIESVPSPIVVKSGSYEFDITVTETNPYKIKAENQQELFETSGDSVAGLLKAITKEIFKSGEEKEDKSQEAEKHPDNEADMN